MTATPVLLKANRRTNNAIRDQRYRDGHHYNSSYWKDRRKTMPSLSAHQTSVSVGMTLGDAGLTSGNQLSGMKVEQGYQQEAFVHHLFAVFANVCFMVKPGVRMEPEGSPRAGLIKSFWFKTMPSAYFTDLRSLFYVNGVKVIQQGLVLNHVDAVALAYWVMCDGSLTGSSLTLHTQGFTQEENTILSSELNVKFGLHSKVVSHKHKYFVITFPAKDASVLRKVIGPHVIPSLMYKVPLTV